MVEQELPYRRQKTPRMRREAAFGVFCLTTVYPTDTHGAHGNSGERKAGKDVFGSGKGRKRLKTSGNRYSQILWEQDAAGSNPVTPTSRQCLHPILGCSYCLLFVYRAAECFVSPLEHHPYMFSSITKPPGFIPEASLFTDMD